jgi:predicted TIM-barrel fold metal-dependent hydrolase
MLNDHFVIDTVTHAFNLEESNFANRQHGLAIRDAIYAFNGTVPPDYGYKLPPSAMFRDWPMSDTVGMLFRESDTDVAVYHGTPITAFKDGLSAVDKAPAALEEWPTRIIGAYATVDPIDGPAAIADLDRQLEMFRPQGLKLYPSGYRDAVPVGWRMDDPKIAYPIYEAAAERGITHFAVHKSLPLGPIPTGPYFHPGDLEGAAATFPELTFEIVHGGTAFTEETAWLLGRFPNIYINLETLPVFLVNRPRVFAKMILGLMHVAGEAALDRMFWASGAMQYHPQVQLDAFDAFTFPDDLLQQFGLSAPLPQITEEHKGKILGENYAQAHGLDIAEMRRATEADEFAREGSDGKAPPYSTTSIAQDVLVDA